MRHLGFIFQCWNWIHRCALIFIHLAMACRIKEKINKNNTGTNVLGCPALEPLLIFARQDRSRVRPSAGPAPTSSEVSLKAQLECQRQTHVIAGTVKPEHRCPFPVRPSVHPSVPPPPHRQASLRLSQVSGRSLR